jgi:hypothetical protein
MKSFASPSFFRLFDLILSATNPGMKQSHWTIDGVDCECERHSFNGPRYGFAIEIFTLARPGKRGWSLMVVKEFWYAGKVKDAGRMPHWAKLTGGQRADVFAWFRSQEVTAEGRLTTGGPSAAALGRVNKR